MKHVIKNDTLEISLSTKVYPLEAIYGTCYVFIDRAYLFLDGDPKKEIKVSIKGKETLSKKQLEALAGEFLNELLSATLRANLDKETKKIRQHIVEQAIFSAVGPEIETGEVVEETVNYEDDPLGIAVPWEDKYGDSKKD
jgi:His-Xaa-Ser system protein HxsD